MGQRFYSRMTSKGQVTVPAELRRELELKPGDTVVFAKVEQGISLMPRRSRVREGFGAAGPPSMPVTDQVIAESLEYGLTESATATASLPAG
jgi:AbrB family looped-hinge helix DNA binding protein